MNKEQENLIATGLWHLIRNSDKISSSNKQIWMIDYNELFGEKEESKEPCCNMDAKGLNGGKDGK